MIETFFGQDALGSPRAFLMALLIGLVFGFALERAGFGSSRKLAGIFYFRDMTVMKVMFTALIVAMLGLLLFVQMGWVRPDQIYFMPSVYGAQIVGGLIFGVGFVMGGWCPGTAAVGLASGKVDALIFLGGVTAGSILFNELYDAVKPLYTWGQSGVRFAWGSLGISRASFALLFTLAAVACFWGAEYIEKRAAGGGRYLKSAFLKAFSLALVVVAAGLFVVSGPAAQTDAAAAPPAAGEAELLRAVEAGEDHVEPQSLADWLMTGDPSLLAVDIRTPEEFAAFHIRGAVNVPMSELPAYLAGYRNRGTVVLYSNGMTHPAETRDALARMGFGNVFILTDGLKGFMEQCLKPVSLRSEPLSDAAAERVNAWRAYFQPSAASEAAGKALPPPGKLPGLVEAAWLTGNLRRQDVRVLDCRPQPEYNGGHVPGSVCVSPESFRGVVGGVSSMLLPARLLAEQVSLMGIRPGDTVVIVPGAKLHDATLVGMAFERLGHKNYAILNGGFARWAAEKRPIDTALPDTTPSEYPVDPAADEFTVGYQTVLDYVTSRRALILDVRPADYFTAAKSDEARAGHIPGAINRPFSQDVAPGPQTAFKPAAELAKAYAAIIPSKDTTVVVHCRTGHQASQTYFVLDHLLGYTHVLWYDAGWSQWASRPELPVAK